MGRYTSALAHANCTFYHLCPNLAASNSPPLSKPNSYLAHNNMEDRVLRMREKRKEEKNAQRKRKGEGREKGKEKVKEKEGEFSRDTELLPIRNLAEMDRRSLTAEKQAAHSNQIFFYSVVCFLANGHSVTWVPLPLPSARSCTECETSPSTPVWQSMAPRVPKEPQ